MINVGETVRVSSHAFDFDGVEDVGASLSFTVNGGLPVLMPWDGADGFVGYFVPSIAGRNELRITATMTDASVVVDTHGVVVSV